MGAVQTGHGVREVAWLHAWLGCVSDLLCVCVCVCVPRLPRCALVHGCVGACVHAGVTDWDVLRP